MFYTCKEEMTSLLAAVRGMEKTSPGMDGIPQNSAGRGFVWFFLGFLSFKTELKWHLHPFQGIFTEHQAGTAWSPQLPFPANSPEGIRAKVGEKKPQKPQCPLADVFWLFWQGLLPDFLGSLFAAFKNTNPAKPKIKPGKSGLKETLWKQSWCLLMPTAVLENQKAWGTCSTPAALCFFLGFPDALCSLETALEKPFQPCQARKYQFKPRKPLANLQTAHVTAVPCPSPEVGAARQGILFLLFAFPQCCKTELGSTATTNSANRDFMTLENGMDPNL